MSFVIEIVSVITAMDLVRLIGDIVAGQERGSLVELSVPENVVKVGNLEED